MSIDYNDGLLQNWEAFMCFIKVYNNGDDLNTNLVDCEETDENIEKLNELWETYKEDFYDTYQGRFDDDEEFAKYIVENMYICEIPDSLQEYFDYEKFANDLLRYDYIVEEYHREKHYFLCV